MPIPPSPDLLRPYARAILTVATGLLLTGYAWALNNPPSVMEPGDGIQAAPGGRPAEGSDPALRIPMQNEPAPPRDTTRPDTSLGAAAPEVIYDVSRLPEPVQRMRRLIMEASRSGEIERLRPLIGRGDDATQFTLGELDGDPIDFLREVSGDEEGQEILAILLEVLESGFVHLHPDTDHEYYAWPYFFALPLDELTPPQRVELFKLVTAGDYEEMQNFGAYIFYRVAITPAGRWVFFVAGD